MNAPAYHTLAPGEVEYLLAPENEHLARAWSRLRGALHGVVSMLSVTYPRPLYYYEEAARRDLVEQPERLRGTPFYGVAVRNVRAAEEIERTFRQHGHTPELHEMADRYLDALLDEFDAIRLYPEVAPRRESQNQPAPYRAVAG